MTILSGVCFTPVLSNVDELFSSLLGYNSIPEILARGRTGIWGGRQAVKESRVFGNSQREHLPRSMGRNKWVGRSAGWTQTSSSSIRSVMYQEKKGRTHERREDEEFAHRSIACTATEPIRWPKEQDLRMMVCATDGRHNSCSHTETA
jgi:hypothetical protein